MMIVIDGGRKKVSYPSAANRIENVTVAEVMKAAGLTHGAFYVHFGSKEEAQKRNHSCGPRVNRYRSSDSSDRPAQPPCMAEFRR